MGNTIGERIRERRRELYLSQTALSKKSGVNRTTISQLENGVRDDILVSTLSDIAKALEVGVEFFLTQE